MLQSFVTRETKQLEILKKFSIIVLQQAGIFD